MAHINVESRRKDPELKYLDKIYLTNDHSLYIALNTWAIVYVDADGTETPIPRLRKSSWFYMLRKLIINNGRFVSSADIYDEAVSGADNAKYEHKLEQKVDEICKEIRKQNFIKDALKKGLTIQKQRPKDFIEDSKAGYILTLPEQGDNLDEEYDIDDDPLAPVLTDTIVPDTDDIIHREKFVATIKRNIESGVKAITISGFGGYGKTSVAQMLYKDYADKNNNTFEHVGYINYKSNLKSSVAAAMSHSFSNFKPNQIWDYFRDRLKNNNHKKLLIIDNVDRDASLNQDPLSETEADLFQEISGWPNLTVILTSRLDEIPGFVSINIDTLGDDKNPEPCIDLFNLYNGSFKDDIENIKKIIKYCNYHTYAIELAAKASKSSKSLNDYYIKLEGKGFNASNRNIKTKYKKYNNNTTAALQIMNLFRVSSLNESDGEILEHFAILPDMEQISEDEMRDWFYLTENDVIRLVEEGWIQCYKGNYYVHPLVKEAVLLSYNDEKLPEKAGGKLISLAKEQIYFFNDDEYKDSLRKIRILDSVLEHINLKDEISHANISLYLADQSRKISNREIALKQYEESEKLFRTNRKNLTPSDRVLYWKATYYRGYVLSYTNSRLIEAEKYLKKALTLSEKLYQEDSSRKNAEHLATSMDHLGYILSNTEDHMDEARIYLEKAYHLRYKLNEEYPGEYKQMLAWTADNLGFLLSFFKDTKEEAEKYLRQALAYREELANGEASSEVAWTASNLGCLYILAGFKYDEAEFYHKKALFECKDLETLAPNTHYADVAYICNNYGMLLIKGFNRPKDAIEQLKKSLGVYRRLEDNSPESYFQETAMVCSNLANILQMYSSETAIEIEAYYQEAISILEDRYKNSKKLKGDKNIALMLADINYNYWVYMLRDDKYIDKRRANRRLATNYWTKNMSIQDENVKSFISNAEFDELSGNIQRKYPLVYYIQGGARKKRIWSNEF